MADAYFEIEEYIWLSEDVYGNVNVAGLVWDDLLEESIEFGREDVLTVFVEQLEETLSIAETFDPHHEAFCNDLLILHQWFGTPLRVRQQVLNLIMTAPLTPVQLAHVHLDVLHGPDTYWEDVADELQCHSSYANAVPYYWDWVYESFWIDMEEPQPKPPLVVVFRPSVQDLVNMRHEVVQEYFFNSKCFEELFIWPEVVWGWDKAVADALGIAEAIQEIIGKMADDYLLFGETATPKVKVLHVMEEAFFIYDEGTHEKYYLLTAADTIDFSESLMEIIGQLIHEALVLQGVPVSGVDRYVSAEDILHAEGDVEFSRFYIHVVDEDLTLTDGEVSFLSVKRTVAETLHIDSSATAMGEFVGLATESLIFADIDSLIHGLSIADSFGAEDATLETWVFNVLVELGFNVADIIT
jgi:hypothetical protein